MNTVVETINAGGRTFIDFALPMLIQSGVLILILLAVDAVLRRRVRAVFRYWIWMLVLAKLVLPPSLGSPVSIGTWFGDTLEVPAASLLEPDSPQAAETRVPELPPPASTMLAPPDPRIAQPPMLPRVVASADVEPPAVEPVPEETAPTTSPIQTPATSLTWQGLTLVVWLVVVLALALLLVQRAYFVRGLVGQADEANRAMLTELEDCRRRLGLRGRVGLRLSPNATSPAVCGLWRPVILIPQTLAPRLRSHDLQAVLLHELAHVKRSDLWINLVQTLLQIIYFYNPLLWLANALIRRTREQAVDEAVLVAMGDTARQYPETLVNIAKLAFTRNPTLSLRLIGVVESKSALTERIKHILNRPLPKTARLGVFGISLIFAVAAVLLPMAKARPLVRPDLDVVASAEEQGQTIVEGRVSSDCVARLPGGATVEFLGIHDCGSENDVWWRPDGEMLPDAPYGYSTILRSNEPNQLYEALFRIRSPAGRTFAKMEWTRGRYTGPGYLHRSSRRSSGDIPDDADNLFTGVLHGPPEAGQVRIDVGVGLENAWELLGAVDVQALQAVATLPDAVVHPAREEGGKTLVTVTHRISDREVRLVAVDRSGSVHEPVGQSGRRGSGVVTCEPRFELPLAEIRQFRLEAQKLTWMAFKGVSLRPGQKTEVRTVLPDGDRASTGPAEPVMPITGPRSDATRMTGAVAKLPNGATVEFVAIRDWGGQDGLWWRPDGEVLPVAPYDDSDALHSVGMQTVYEVLFRISGPAGSAFAEMELTHGAFRTHHLLRGVGDSHRAHSDIPRNADNLFSAMLHGQPETDQAQIDVGVGLDSAWELLGALDGRAPDVAVTLPGAVIHPAVEEGGKTSVAASNQIVDREVRLVAVDKNGFVRKPTKYGVGRGEDTSRYEVTFDLPLAEIQSIRLEVQRLAWVVFKNVSLRPGQRTDVQIDVQAQDSGSAVPEVRDDSSTRGIILPDVDHEAMMLDLATGQLIPLPQVEPANRLLEAIDEFTRGDLVLDHQSLILVRGATSPQATEGPEGLVKLVEIGAPLPRTITVTTREGRQCRIEVLSIDDKTCTLRSSPVPTDRGVGGGAPVERENAVATTRAELPDLDLAARLPNGVTVELLAYSRLEEMGLEWWTPKGERTTIPNIYEADAEGHGTLIALRVEPEPEYVLAHSYQPPDIHRDLKIWRMEGSNTWLAALGEERNYVNVEVYARVKDPPVVQSVSVAQKDANGEVPIGAYGSQRITELTAVDSDTLQFTVTALAGGPRAVAVRDVSGGLHPVRLLPQAPLPGDPGAPKRQPYEADLPLKDLAGIVIEGVAARGGEVKFRNILLAGGQSGQVRVEITPGQEKPMWYASEFASELRKLGAALRIYAQSHAEQYPADLPALRGSLSEPEREFVERHVIYLGAGKTSAAPAGTVLAYVKTLLPFGFGTYVLYPERQVEFELPAKLKELEIAAVSSQSSSESPSSGVDPAAGWQDIGEAIPPDANDARTLAPGVVLDGIGQDVEGKVFVSAIRDLDATAGTEFRFVIHWKDGRVQEPRYHTALDRFGRRLWEKFTFDAWYNHRQIECFRLQSRRGEEGRDPSIPSANDEIVAAAGTAEPSSAGAAPPGRYALSFDGRGDHLFIPDSESLRSPASLTVEIWIKPEFGPGPHEHRPGWGVLAKGAYTGTGRVRMQGFGVWMDNFDPNANTLMFLRGQTTERGISVIPTLLKLPADWIHITEEFDDYILAPGQPLVIGLPLTPADDPLYGQIAEIRIWDGTRVPDTRQYEGEALTGAEPGLVACWTFEEGRGQIAHDISPNGNHARLGSSVSADDADPAWIDLGAAQSPHDEISGQVLDPDGQPAVGAQVALFTDTPSVWIDDASVVPNQVLRVTQPAVVQTDERGWFRFVDEPNDSSMLMVTHAKGYVGVSLRSFMETHRIHLQPGPDKALLEWLDSKGLSDTLPRAR